MKLDIKLRLNKDNFEILRMISSTYKGKDASLNLSTSEKCKIAAQIFFGLLLTPIGVGASLLRNVYQDLRSRKMKILANIDRLEKPSQDSEATNPRACYDDPCYDDPQLMKLPEL